MKKNILWIGLIVFLLGAFFYRTAYVGLVETSKESTWHWDLDFWFAAGKLWAEGKSPYDLALFRQEIAELRDYNELGEEVFSYPPLMISFFLILQLFPLSVDAWIMYGVNLVLIFVLLYLMGLILSRYRKIGFPEVTLLVLMLSTGIRTNIKYNQLGLIIGIFIFASFWFYLKERPVLSGIALGLVALKPTSLPLIGIFYLLKKQYKMIIIGIMVAVILGLLPLLVGGHPVIQTYSEFLSSASQQAAGIDDTSPFVPFSATQYELSILIYRILDTDSGNAPLISWIVVVILIAIIIWVMQAGKKMPYQDLFGFSLLSVMTMLFIYHRSYEIYLMFPAILYLYLYAYQVDSRWKKIALFVLSWGLLLIDVLPSTLSVLAIDYFPELADSHLFRVVAPIKVWMLLISLVSLILLKAFQKRLIPDRTSEALEVSST